MEHKSFEGCENIMWWVTKEGESKEKKLIIFFFYLFLMEIYQYITLEGNLTSLPCCYILIPMKGYLNLFSFNWHVYLFHSIGPQNFFAFNKQCTYGIFLRWEKKMLETNH